MAAGVSVLVLPYPPGISALTDTTLLGLANRVLNNSRTRVNVDTGYLRSTGTAELTADGARVAYRARYAAAVHNGHGSYGGNPYLADALVEELNRL